MTDFGGYVPEGEFATTGGGRCAWTFARKGSKSYFLKRFLKPKPLVSGSAQLGGPKSLDRQRRRCEAFESRQNKLLAALDGKAASGGNLIAPIEFFECDGCYYKVTEKIETRGLTFEDVQRLPPESQVIILRSVANSVRILHSIGVVHGDIKTDNILIRPRSDVPFTASLIDFDDSYFSGHPPLPPEEFVFDPPYASPEIFSFIETPEPALGRRLTHSADVFALGVVFHEYLAGEKPNVLHDKGRYLGEAIGGGGSVQLSLPAAWSLMAPLITKMLSPTPASRPEISQVLEALKSLSTAKHLPPSGPSIAPAPVRGGLRINLRTDAKKPEGPLPEPTALRGSLAPKKTR